MYILEFSNFKLLFIMFFLIVFFFSLYGFFKILPSIIEDNKKRDLGYWKNILKKSDISFIESEGLLIANIDEWSYEGHIWIQLVIEKNNRGEVIASLHGMGDNSLSLKPEEAILKFKRDKVIFFRTA